MTTANGTDRHNRTTPVHIVRETKERLDQMGRMHESYSDLITRILNAVDRRSAAIVCVGCGCTDDAACDGGCSWVKVDDELRAGICSACVETFVSVEGVTPHAGPGRS
jgi:hypothetical protein